jgi:sorting nexin-13
VTVIEELTDAEIEMLVETFFAFVIETFDLREPNQWLRRKLLGVFKQLLKQAYGDTLNKVLTNAINNSFSEEAILRYLYEARQALFPDGVFIGRRPPPPARSEDQKFATMVEARTVFLKRTPDFVQNMAGRYNAVCGMTRIFHALQHKTLNKTLIYASFDILLKLFFSERLSQ